MLGAGDHVDARVLGQGEILLAEWIGVQQRRALLPVLGRGVGFDQLGIAAVAAEQGTFLLGQRIGNQCRRKRKLVLREAVVLVLRAGARRLAEWRVEEDAADAGDVRMDTIEDLAALLVAIEAGRDVVTQIAPRLREADGQGMADLAAGGGERRRIVAQPAHDVAGRGEAQPLHFGIGGLVVEFVEPARFRLGAVGELDRPRIDERPLAARHLGARIAGALAHR